MAKNEADLLELIMDADDYDEFDADLERELLDDERDDGDNDSGRGGSGDAGSGEGRGGGEDVKQKNDKTIKNDNKQSDNSSKTFNKTNNNKRQNKRSHRGNSNNHRNNNNNRNQMLNQPRMMFSPNNRIDPNIRFHGPELPGMFNLHPNPGPPMFTNSPFQRFPQDSFPGPIQAFPPQHFPPPQPHLNGMIPPSFVDFHGGRPIRIHNPSIISLNQVLHNPFYSSQSPQSQRIQPSLLPHPTHSEPRFSRSQAFNLSKVSFVVVLWSPNCFFQ